MTRRDLHGDPVFTRTATSIPSGTRAACLRCKARAVVMIVRDGGNGWPVLSGRCSCSCSVGGDGASRAAALQPRTAGEGTRTRVGITRTGTYLPISRLDRQQLRKRGRAAAERRGRGRQLRRGRADARHRSGDACLGRSSPPYGVPISPARARQYPRSRWRASLATACDLPREIFTAVSRDRHAPG